MRTEIKILIVEDEGIIAVDLKSCVEQLGYTVLACVDSAEKALELVEQEPPDLVLMDIVLKGPMDGIAAAALMRSRWGISVIFITAYPDQEWVERAKLVNPFGYILKPFQDDEIKVNIEIALYTSGMDKERRKAEEMLRQSIEKYRSLAASVDSMYLVDRECRYLFLNEGHRLRFGLTMEDIVGRKYGDFHSEEDSKKFTEKVREIFKTGEPITQEYRSERDGRFFLRTFTPIIDRSPAGEISEVVVVSKDITKRKKAEEELRIYQKELQALAIKMTEVEETERKEIARTLHDLVGQNLTALNLNLNIILEMMTEDQKSPLFTRLEDSQKLLEETTQYIREVMSDLRPSVLDDFGLLAALHWYGQRFQGRTGIQTKVEGEEFSPRFHPTMETIIFRIAQEALANVLKHASAREVNLRLEKVEDRVRLTITDDGQGFSFKGFRFGGEKRGWGIATMKERAVALRGDLQILTEPGKGTRVILQLPVEG
jgi:PAS domain S-box